MQQPTHEWQPPVKDRILHFIDDNPKCTILDICLGTGIHERLVRAEIAIFKAKKQITAKQRKGFRTMEYKIK